jgi:hypothetical protein
MEKNFTLNGVRNRDIRSSSYGREVFEMGVRAYVTAYRIGIGRPYEFGLESDVTSDASTSDDSSSGESSDNDSVGD